MLLVYYKIIYFLKKYLVLNFDEINLYLKMGVFLKWLLRCIYYRDCN